MRWTLIYLLTAIGYLKAIRSFADSNVFPYANIDSVFETEDNSDDILDDLKDNGSDQAQDVQLQMVLPSSGDQKQPKIMVDSGVCNALSSLVLFRAMNGQYCLPEPEQCHRYWPYDLWFDNKFDCGYGEFI